MIPQTHKWESVITDPVHMAELTGKRLDVYLKQEYYTSAKSLFQLGSKWFVKPHARYQYLPDEDYADWNIVIAEDGLLRMVKGYRMLNWGEWEFYNHDITWTRHMIDDIRYTTVKVRGRAYILRKETILINRENDVLLEFVAWAYHRPEGTNKMKRKKVHYYREKIPHNTHVDKVFAFADTYKYYLKKEEM